MSPHANLVLIGPAVRRAIGNRQTNKQRASYYTVCKFLTARKSWNGLQISSVDVIFLVNRWLLHSLRLAPLYVQSLSVEDKFVERPLGGSFGRYTRRVLDERTLLARNNR